MLAEHRKDTLGSSMDQTQKRSHPVVEVRYDQGEQRKRIITILRSQERHQSTSMLCILSELSSGRGGLGKVLSRARQSKLLPLISCERSYKVPPFRHDLEIWIEIWCLLNELIKVIILDDYFILFYYVLFYFVR
jgi:hypothetical protein